MECVALDVERLHLGIADFDTLFVGGGVERESIKNRVQRCWIRPAGLGKPLVIQ
jgi:hypothetical protein